MVQSVSEGKHAGEFLVNEFDLNYNREVGVLSSGQKVVDGQLVQLSGSEMVAKDTIINTAGEFTTAIYGIVIGNWDASATGTNADIPDVPVLRRGPAIVNGDRLTYPAGTPQRAEVLEDLALMGIVVRFES